MDIGSEPNVIGKVPADVIGIVIDDDVIGIPQPAVTETNVVWCNREIKTAEPEATGTTACKVPDMAASDTAGEVAMFPGMIQMVMGIVAAGIMANPLSIGMDVGSIRMSFLVAEFAVFIDGVSGGYSGRTVLRNVLMAATDFRSGATCMFFVLCQG